MRSFPILCLLLFAGHLSAQVPGLSWEASYDHGRILKHTSKIIYDIPERTWGFHLNASFQTWGQKEWQQHQGYPTMGMALQYYYLGEPQVLGHAWGLLPNVSVRIVERPFWNLRFQMGSGIAILTRPYDRLENPTNNAIGSVLNNLTAFRLKAQLRIHPHWRLLAGGSFTHFSNASAQAPNLGINIPAAVLGLTYTPHPVASADFIRHAASKRPEQRWGLHLHAGMAFREGKTIGGPKNPIFIGSIAAVFRFTKVHQLLAGFEQEFNRDNYLFGLHTYNYPDRRTALRGASRTVLFLADELKYGPWAILLQAGIYISPRSEGISTPFSNKLALRYYLPPIGQPSAQFHIGMYMKSHKFTAEYIALAMGAEL